MKTLRKRVLRIHGLEPTEGGRLRPSSVVPDLTGRKTLAMLRLEAGFDTPIEVLLVRGSLRQVAKELGISKSTASKWIQRLRLRDGNK